MVELEIDVSSVKMWSNGLKCEYGFSILSRLNGPALTYSNGNKFWYYNGEYVDCSTQEEFERVIKLRLLW